jgi:hypothetical protein
MRLWIATARNDFTLVGYARLGDERVLRKCRREVVEARIRNPARTHGCRQCDAVKTVFRQEFAEPRVSPPISGRVLSSRGADDRMMG